MSFRASDPDILLNVFANEPADPKSTLIFNELGYVVVYVLRLSRLIINLKKAANSFNSHTNLV